MKSMSLGVACFLAVIINFGPARAETVADSTITVKTSWSFWSGIHKGIYVTGAEKPLFTLGSFPSRDPATLLARRSTEASDLYMKYRSKQISSSLVGLGGVVSFGIGFVVVLGDEDLAGAFLLGGVVAGLATFVIRGFADRNLDESVWLYNETFSDELR